MQSWLCSSSKTKLTLHDAARCNAIGQLSRLVTGGADVNALDECGLACLHIVAEQGNVGAAQLLADNKADVNIRDSAGSCPLHWAVMKSQGEMVAVLIGLGAHINAVDQNGFTPLLLAAMFSDTHTVKTLISKGADINATDATGCTALHSASGRGDILMVQTLLDSGANVAASDKRGSTSLHTACSLEGHQSDLVRLLISKSADPNARDECGVTPLHCTSSHNGMAAASALIDAGADLDAADNLGRRALHFACKGDHVAMVQLLCEAGADVDVVTNMGWKPLHYGCKLRHFDIVTTLLEAGAQVNQDVIPQDGGSPLHLAVEQMNVELTQLLIRHGADVNAVDAEGWTPLHIATSSCHEALVCRLMGHGADVNKITKGGESCLHTAVGRHDHPIVKLLLANQNCNVNIVCTVRMTSGPGPVVCSKNINPEQAYEVSLTPTELAILLGEPQCVRCLMERGGQLTNNTFGPAHLAAMHNQVQALSVMMETLHLDMTLPDKYGNTPLHWGCIKGHVDLVHLLFHKEWELKHQFLEAMQAAQSAAEEDSQQQDNSNGEISVNGTGAQPSANGGWRPWLTVVDQMGATALHAAALWGHNSIIQSILETKTGPTLVNVPDHSGNTPLHHACKNGNSEGMKMLISNGGFIDKPNKNGQTPLELANHFGYFLPVDVLEKWNFQSSRSNGTPGPRHKLRVPS